MDFDSPDLVQKDKFLCCLCGDGKSMAFGTQEELQDHFRGHGNDVSSSNAKRFKKRAIMMKCDVCEKSFDDLNKVVKHKAEKHPDAKAHHFCKFCGKRFPLRTSLDLHLKFEHKSDKISNKLYKCGCGEIFYTEKGIEYHMKFHKQVNNILIPDDVTMPPSKKIKRNVNGEFVSVFYCHFCGCEYLLKFNLRRHIETQHTDKLKDKKPEQLIKCSLCAAIFYSKNAYDTHNLLHNKDDLYITSEEHRSRIVTKLDCDLDPSRIPTLWESIEQKQRRSQIRKNKVALTTTSSSCSVQNTTTTTTSTSASIQQSSSSSAMQHSASGSSVTLSKTSKNRAIVDSDNENIESDSSDEEEENLQKISQKPILSLQKDSEPEKRSDQATIQITTKQQELPNEISETNAAKEIIDNGESESDEDVQVCDNSSCDKIEDRDAKIKKAEAQSEKINQRIKEAGRHSLKLSDLKHASINICYFNDEPQQQSNKTVILKQISAAKRKPIFSNNASKKKARANT